MAPRRAAGFTLIELVVVLAILALVTAALAGAVVPSRGVALRAAAAELADTMRLARAQAIFEDRPVEVAIDLAHRRYRAGGAVHALPPGLGVELVTVAEAARWDRNAGSIRFLPDGSSSGGSVTLASGGVRMAIGIDWISGRVSLGEPR